MDLDLASYRLIARRLDIMLSPNGYGLDDHYKPHIKPQGFVCLLL